MIVINKHSHQNATVELTQDYSDYQNEALIELSVDDIIQTVALLPMAFQLYDGRWRIVGITSIDNNENLFVSPDDGSWKGYYCPTSIRKFPLDLVLVPGDEKKLLTMVADETSSAWHQDGGKGERLFNDQGEKSVFLSRQIELIKRSYYLKQKVNQSLQNAFKQNLLVPWNPKDISWFAEMSLFAVNNEMLAKNNSESGQIEPWFLRLLLGQMFSMAGIKRLRYASNRKYKQQIGMTDEDVGEILGLSQDDLELDFDNIDLSKLNDL